MRLTVIAAATLGALALGASTSASAGPANSLALKGVGVAPETSLVQEVARRRVCTYRFGKTRCVWKQVRNKKRWQWRKNKRGLRVRIFI